MAEEAAASPSGIGRKVMGGLKLAFTVAVIGGAGFAAAATIGDLSAAASAAKEGVDIALNSLESALA